MNADDRPRSGARAPSPVEPQHAERAHDASFDTLHHEATADAPPASVLVDAAHRVLHRSAGAGRFVEPAADGNSHRLTDIVPAALRPAVRDALSRAAEVAGRVAVAPVRLERDGRAVYVLVTVRPVPARSGYAVVAFDEFDDVPDAPAAPDMDAAALVERLESELGRQKQSLVHGLERAIASAEALKASNEELQTINEELRSTTDELATGKEELQSVNEELITVNDELRVRIEETGKINDDLQNLIASTEIATIFLDGALRVTRFTPRALDLFPLRPTDVGRSLFDIRHRLDYPELANDAAESLRCLRQIEREVASAATDDDRSGHRYLVRVLPYRTVQNRIEGVIVTFVDVTHLRRAEARVRESEAHLRLAAATTKDFAIMTMDGDGIVTTWNEGAERIFGYTAAEIVGQPSSRLFTPEDRAAGAPEHELATARSLGRAEDNRWHLRKDNTRFYCSGVVTPFESGELRGMAKIARDITGMRREQTAREALLHEERMARTQYEAASRLKDEFLAVMSHELKHPLNLIHVNAELLSRMPNVRDNPAAVRAAQVIRRTVVGQGKIIDDLLDLSRGRTGKLTLQVEAVDLDKTVAGILGAIEPDRAAKRIALEYHVDEGLPPVACDPVRIEQIAWNLLSNALKFTPEGGRIDVCVEHDGDEARLSVTDSGRGIAPRFLTHVFDMFGQESSGPARAEGGMGIGLALVRQLVVAQGGRVEAHSDGLGQGARFTVWVPFHAMRPHDVADGDEGLHPRSLAGMHVLVVEDSREAIEPFVELLRLEGAHPVAALDGREAIAVLDRQPFDLIISDIGMPDLGGYEFIEAVRRRERSRHIVAIALTGFGRPKDKQQAMEAGFDAHITKPASIRDIRRVLAQLPTPPTDA